jgi:hypothetical protein
VAGSWVNFFTKPITAEGAINQKRKVNVSGCNNNASENK